MELASAKIEERVYPPGLCVPRHAHETNILMYIASGTHWSGHSRGGDSCAPRTMRFLPAGEPHENYFPVASRCLQIELRQPTLDLAPGQIRSGAALGRRLYREFRQGDDLAALDIDAVILQIVLKERGDASAPRGTSSRLARRRPRDAARRAADADRVVARDGAAPRADQPAIPPLLRLHDQRVRAAGPRGASAITPVPR